MERRELRGREAMRVQGQIADIVLESFGSRPMPSGVITEAECARRVDLATAIWNKLWDDARWSHDRIMDHLPRYLVMRIDGVDLPPETERQAGEDEHVMWAPDTAGEVEAERRLSALAVTGNSGLILPAGPSIIIPGSGDNRRN